MGHRSQKTEAASCSQVSLLNRKIGTTRLRPEGGSCLACVCPKRQHKKQSPASTRPFVCSSRKAKINRPQEERFGMRHDTANRRRVRALDPNRGAPVCCICLAGDGCRLCPSPHEPIQLSLRRLSGHPDLRYPRGGRKKQIFHMPGTSACLFHITSAQSQ